MPLFFVIITIGTFISLLAAEYGATGAESTAHYLLTKSTHGAAAIALLSATGGILLVLSVLWWVLSAIF